MHQAGLLQYAVQKTSQKNNPCSIDKKNKEKPGQKHDSESDMMKLLDFSGAFFILCAGTSSALVAFILEWIGKIVFAA